MLALRTALLLAFTCTSAACLLAVEDKPIAAPMLERKNYTEKTTSHKIDENTKQKIPLAAKFDMVYVPGGEFLMGSPETEAGRDSNEGPSTK